MEEVRQFLMALMKIAKELNTHLDDTVVAVEYSKRNGGIKPILSDAIIHPIYFPDHDFPPIKED